MSGITVLVPTRRDREDDVRLDHLLHSLLAQTRRPARVVVRDEGLAGAYGVRAVRQFADLLAREGVDVEYRRAPRSTGVAAARRDLVASLGPLAGGHERDGHGDGAGHVAFVDDDMALAPDALAVLADVLDAHPDGGFVQGQKVEADARRRYWNDVNPLHGDPVPAEPFRTWFGDAALMLVRRRALAVVDWDVVTRYEVDGLGGEDVAISLMIADRHPCYAVPAAVGWHLSPAEERWRWEAPSDVLQLELLRPHVSADTLRRALPHLAHHVR